MAGRKRHSGKDIVRKLRRADELAAEGNTGEEIAAELDVSAATLYNWRRSYGGMDTDGAKERREQTGRLKRLLAEAELLKDALREVENSEPGRQAPRRGHAHHHVAALRPRRIERPQQQERQCDRVRQLRARCCRRQCTRSNEEGGNRHPGPIR
jgi:putative transposase